jgi:DNA-binding transcriptional LysR family regulator
MIDNLKAFAAVIDSKSLTKASSRLHLTQSAISRRIQQLEEVLGGPLLDRTQRPPSANALGRRVYEQSLPILRAVNDLMTLTRKDAAPCVPAYPPCRKLFLLTQSQILHSSATKASAAPPRAVLSL